MVELVLLLLGLFFLAVVVTRTALVGRALWLLFRWLFPTPAEPPRERPPAVWVDCARCGKPIPPGQSRCSRCGLEQASAVAAELSDLRATLRQLYRFHRQGILDIAALERLQAQVEARRRTLTGKEIPEAPPTPVLPPAAAKTAAPAETPADRPPPVRKAAELPRPLIVAERVPAPPPPRAQPEPVPVRPPAAPPPVTAPPRAERPPAAPAPPWPPRRSFAELLAAFMEQRNILGGELVGGLLIVGCSIALVISLWKTLEENPLYQSGIFVSVTAALFGAGLYTLSHWKLESTSRGLLVIATLLVPLNLLAITTGQAQGGSDPLALGVELAALLIFGGLLSLAGKVLVPEGRWRFAGVILVVAAVQLLVPRFLEAPAGGSRALFFVLGGLPVALYGLGTGSVLYTTTRRGPLRPGAASALFGLLGMATFALAVTLGQLVFRSVALGANLAEVLQQGAPLIGLAGWPVLLGGISIRRALAEEAVGPDAEPAARTGGLRTAGTATALIGMLILLAALVLAWPRPVPVIVVCALNCVLLMYVAFRHRLPLAHVAALPCLVLGYLAVVYLATGVLGDADRLGLALAVTNTSGKALVGLVLGLALAAEGLHWVRLPAHGIFYAAGAGGVALVSLIGVTFPSRGAWAIQDAMPALIVSALYGAGALTVNLRWQRPMLSSLGLALLVGATLWALWSGWRQQVPHWAAVLAAEGLVLLLLAAGLGHPVRGVGPTRSLARSARRQSSLLCLLQTAKQAALPTSPARAVAFAEPLARSAEAVALLALVAAVWGGVSTLAWSPDFAIAGGCLAGLFLLLAAVEQRWLPAWLAGCLLTATAVAGTGWAGTIAEVAALGPWLALASAASACFMAVVAVAIGRPPSQAADERAEAPRWSLAVLGTAWLETAALAGVLALVLAGTSLAAEPSPLHTYTAGLLTVTALLLAWGYQSVWLSWLGAVLALGGITHGFLHATDLTIPTHLLDFALLTHATLLLLVGLVLRRTLGDRTAVARLYTEPFRQAGLITSFLALPLLLLPTPEPPSTPTLGLFWLSAVWLVIAWLRRWPVLFTAFQAVLTLAVLFACLTWLERQDWFQAYPAADLARLWDPRSWQVYGAGLALLSLAWVLARIVGRAHPVAQALLEPGWPGVDRLVIIAVVIGQFILAVLAVAPALARELSGPVLVDAVTVWPPALRAYALGAGAWMLLGLVGLALVVALWERWAAAAVLGLVLLAGTAPVLWAGGFEEAHVTGLALRWGLASTLLALAPAVWWRAWLRRQAARLGCRPGAPFDLPRAVRVLVNVLMAIPVVVLTLVTALAHWGEPFPLGRTQLLAGVAPLVWVSVVWVGHALRERSAGYAFAAGWVANLAVTGGYALAFIQDLPPGQVPWELLGAQLVQLASLTAALWAIGWTAVRVRLFAADFVGQAALPVPPATDRQGCLSYEYPVPVLLRVQVGIAAAAVAGLIGGALGLLLADYPLAPPWTREAGTVLGWLALGAVTAAAGYSRVIPAAVRPGAAGLAAAGLLACGVERVWPGRGWGYRALMLGWAAYPLAWVLAVGFPPVVLRKPVSPRWLDAAARWAHLAGILAVLLALQAAFGHGEQLWAAGAIALVSLAWLVLAVGRRREAEVFAAGLGVNLAASLVVWHAHPFGLEQWRVLLVQANVIVASLVALLWLGLRRWLYPKAELTLAAAPVLAFQVVLVLIGNAVLLLEPVALLIAHPDQPLPAEALQAGRLWGWLTLILALIVAARYALQVAATALVHVLCGFGLAFGALAACATGRSEGVNWPAFHLLLAAWTAAGPVALTLGGVAEIVRLRLLRRLTHGEPEEVSGSAESVAPLLQTWVRVLGALTTLLVLRTVWLNDPRSPYWPAGAALAVSITVGALALWSRGLGDIYASGLLFNLVGSLLWMVWGPGTISSFAATQALCLAGASGLWSVLELAARSRATDRGVPPFPHFAAILGLGILSAIIAGAVTSSVAGEAAWAAVPLTWAALGGLVLALVILLWDPTASFTPAGLYAAGVLALGLALHGLNLGPREFGWTASWTCGLFVLLAAGIAWSAGHVSELWRILYLPNSAGGRPRAWYFPAQGLMAGLVLGLSLWIVLDFPSAAEQLAGPLAVALLIPAGVLMADRSRRGTAFLQTATLLAGVLAVVEAGWAFLETAGREPSWLWLHRSVIGMVALAFLTVLYGLVFSRWLPDAAGWATRCRRLGPVLAVLASLLVAVILVQEAMLYEGHKTIATLLSRMLKLEPTPNLSAAAVGAPMAPPAIGAVAVALLALIIAGVRFAVLPGADPFGLSERGRRFYVYAAEVLLVLMFVHFRLTVPGVFRQGLFLRYWPFVIMAIAFGGVALGEFLRRRGVPVLAEPLARTGVFLPLLPVVAFWVLPGDRYALLWFSAGLVYAFLALARRSFRFGLFAALAANMGLWVLLYHHGWHFYVHPQVWLIPLALIALVSEHANRDRLTPAQSAGLRYLALLVVYLSSTADLFIAGLGRSPLLTLVLAVLSVLGVLAGMLLRVRAFLFLGVTFLLLVILTMIWHAGVDQRQTWILWTSGIVLGVAILTLFGVFEKRRNDVLRFVEELRRWD